MDSKRIYLTTEETAELIRQSAPGQPLSLSFGIGCVWLREPYKQDQLAILAKMRGIDPTPSPVPSPVLSDQLGSTPLTVEEKP